MNPDSFMTYYFSKVLICALLLSITVTSCSDDDDYGLSIEVTSCDAAQRVILDDTSNRQALSVDEYPVDIRSYIASELSGFSIDSIWHISTAAASYYAVWLETEEKLLFDDNLNFLCGIGDFMSRGGDDEYDDEYIDIADLPQNIIDYVAANYPNETIVKAELDDGEYEIELSNDVELYFDIEGNFLRID